MKEIINLDDVDIYLDECQSAVTEVDEDVDLFLEGKEKYNILQLDGLEDKGVSKKYFSVNCKVEELIVLINFFRCFENLWNSSIQHALCIFDKDKSNCFFCLMRSTCLRINTPRLTGPKSLKIVEFVSQLSKYEEAFNWDWIDDVSDMTALIENTIKLLISSETSVFDNFVLQKHCKQCESCHSFSKKLVFDLQLDGTEKEKVFSLHEIMLMLIKDTCKNCQKKIAKHSGFVILRFSHPAKVKIDDNDILFMEQRINHVSHITEEIYVGPKGYFKIDEDIFFQDDSGNICQTYSEFQSDVRYLALSFGTYIGQKDNTVVYGQKELKYLDKQYLKIIDPKQHKERLQKQKEYEQTEERKRKRKAIDKKRDQTEKRKQREKSEARKQREQTKERKTKRKAIDKKREQTEARKNMHQAIDKARNESKKRKRFFSDYEQTEARRLYKKRRYDESSQSNIIAKLDSDTGFDLICSCCL